MFLKNTLYVFGSFFLIRTINKKIEESIDAVIDYIYHGLITNQ